jgi:hypothetical protein
MQIINEKINHINLHKKSKNNMKSILTVAIPSNNRTELLDQALRSLLSEPGLGETWNILISDNSITNNTLRLIEQNYLKIKGINYRRSLDSPSLDQNVNQAVASSKGQYVWVFGDDDLVVPGFIPELINYIEDNNPDIVLINSRSFQDDRVVEESRIPDPCARIFNHNENDAFLMEFGRYLTYIAGFVMRRDLWLNSYRPENVGSFFSHLDTVCCAKIGNSAHFLPLPGISLRMHFQTWVGKHFEIWNINFPKIIWGLSGYSDSAKNVVIKKYPLKTLNPILSSRAYGRFNLYIWWTVLCRAKNASVVVIFFGFIIGLLPREFFRLTYIFYIRFARRNHDLGFSPELALAQLKRSK